MTVTDIGKGSYGINNFDSKIEIDQNLPTAACDKLYEELIATIFTFVIEENGYASYREFANLLKVCKKWRKISLTAPVLTLQRKQLLKIAICYKLAAKQSIKQLLNPSEIDLLTIDESTLRLLLSYKDYTNPIKDLIKKHSQVNLKDNLHEILLEWAVEVNDPEVINILLSHKSNISFYGDSASTHASKKGHLAALKFVFDYMKDKIQQNVLTNISSTILNQASENGHIEVLKWLLIEDPKIELTHELGYEAICLAILHNHLEISKLLLDEMRKKLGSEDMDCKAIFLGAFGSLEEIRSWLTNIKDHQRINILQKAAYQTSLLKGRLEVVQMFLNDFKVDPSLNNNYAICTASEKGYLEIVQLLLNDLRIDPSVNDNRAIQIASENGHLEVVKLLLNDSRIDPSASLNYAIRWASTHGHTEVVRVLLEDSRVDPSANNNRAIHIASENGHLEVVKMLLDHPKLDPEHYTMAIASLSGHAEIVRMLLNESKIDPSAKINPSLRGIGGHYPIGLASQNGHTEVVRILLKDSRVDPSVKDNYAIGLASKNGHLEIVKILLKDSRTAPSANNGYALIKASENGHLEIVKILLKDSRVDPSANNSEAIGLASRNGHLEIVKILLKDSRVDPSANDNYALNRARRYGHSEVVQILLKALERKSSTEHAI